MAWRNCQASLTLVAAINAKYPARDRGSDGTIGDAAHATRSSDHNPWLIVDGVGVVRGRDITNDPAINLPAMFEELRKLGAAGDPRLTGGGYLILRSRITRPDWSGWAVYTGSNPHDKHGHVSFSRNRAGFDSQAPWPFLSTAPAPTAALTEDDMQLTDPIPNANPDTKSKTPTTTVGNLLQDAQANAFYAARNTAGVAAALAAMTQLVAQQNGLVLEDVRRVVAEEVARVSR
jgi:hypothetical protein